MSPVWDLATIIILVVFLLVYVYLTGRRETPGKMRRAETLEQRARRRRNAKDAAVIATILDDR